MRMEEIYEFVVLSHYLNFTIAAERLSTSQSNLSKHIAEMEKELGFSLFERKKNLELTPAGVAFQENAIQIHHLYLDSISRSRRISMEVKSELVIQEPYLLDACGDLIYRSAHEFSRRYPNINVRFFSEAHKKSTEALRAGQIDIALTVDTCNAKRLERMGGKKSQYYFPVIREPLFAWMSREHPLATHSCIQLRDLVNAPIRMTANREFDPMRFAVVDMFEKQLHQKPLLQPSHSTQSLVDFFMNTDDPRSLFLVNASTTRTDVLRRNTTMIAVPIEDEYAELTSYLVTNKEFPEKQVEDFIALVAELSKEVIPEAVRPPTIVNV